VVTLPVNSFSNNVATEMTVKETVKLSFFVPDVLIPNVCCYCCSMPAQYKLLMLYGNASRMILTACTIWH